MELKRVVHAKLKPHWTVKAKHEDGTEYDKTIEAKHRSETFAPDFLDKPITLHQGAWTAIPEGEAGLRFVTRLQTQMRDHPHMQQYELEIREEPANSAKPDEAFPEIPVKKWEAPKAAEPAPEPAEPAPEPAKSASATTPQKAPRPEAKP